MTAAAATPGPSGNLPPSAEASFSRLYSDYYDRVFGYCVRRTGRANAQDAAAEVFSIAWRKFDEVPSGEATLSWLYGVAYRVLSHQWRSKRRRHNLTMRIGGLRAESPPDPEDQIVRRSEDRRVLDAASRLKESDQEILRLAGWEQLPHHQIAEILGISLAAVDQRFSRAKKRLAKVLAPPAGSAEFSPRAAEEGGGS